jgi:hypothetical protein
VDIARSIPFDAPGEVADGVTRLARVVKTVGRTPAWLGRFRRLAARYELRQDIHEGFVSLAVRSSASTPCSG